jgi:F-type H+-transporting ATPase subunit b
MELEFRHVLTQVLAFFIMYWILKRYAWDRLYAIIDERRKHIESEFTYIENEKLGVKKLQDDYQQKLSDIDTEARAKYQEVIAEGKKVAEEIQKATQKESQNLMNKVKADLEKEVIKAKTYLRNEVVDLVVAASNKVVQADLDSEKQKKIIEEFVDKADLK